MPQALPIIVGAAGAAAGATAVTIAISQILAAVAVGLYERDKARKKARDAARASLQDRVFTIRSGVASRQYIIGTVRTGGVLMNADTIGANKAGFDTVIAYADNRCELVGYYVGDENIGTAPTDAKYGKQQLNDVYEEFVVTGPTVTVTLGGRPADGVVHAAYHTPNSGRPGLPGATLAPTGSNVAITGLPAVSGVIVSITYKIESGEKLRLQFKPGAADQESTPWVGFNSERWTTSHRLLGVCHSRALYIWDEDLWANGAQEIGVILKGGQVETPDGSFGFYDPRSGQALAYTDNPALQWGWLRTLPKKYGGMGVPSDWIDWQTVAIAANICDELITVKKFDGSGYEQIKRYQCHAVLSLDRPLSDLEQIILSAMAGKRAFSGGLYRVVAGAFRPAAITLRDADVAGAKPIGFLNGDPNDTPPNVCTARFADARRDYGEQDAKPVRNTGYISADGVERPPLDLTFEGSTDERQVNYLMGVALETARPGFSFTLSVRGIGEDIALLDTVAIDITNRAAYAGKTFEVLASVDNWDGTYDLTLSEIKATTFALDPDTFTPVDPPELPDLSYLWNVPAITGFTVEPGEPTLLPDGTAISRIECSWDPPPVAGVQQGGRIEIRYKSSRGDWITVAALPGDAIATTITAAILDSDVYQFQIRAVSSIGSASIWTDAFLQIIGTPIDVKSMRLIASSLFFKIPASGSGTISPASIALDITRGGGLANAVAFTTTPTVTLGGSGDHRTLAYTDIPADVETVKINVQVDEDNKLFVDTITIAKIRDGTQGPDYTPDVTPPPSPTGLIASAALFHIQLQWDAATYTVGHGHASTEVYAALVPSGGPQPTFASAASIGGTPGRVFSHDVGTGQTWAYWIKHKTVDGVMSMLPAGGTNGVQATTGKIAGADLNPLIIDASKLADGSITPQKVAAGAIDATKFAAGIEPITTVTTLPSTLVTRNIFNITDAKLYRWNGSAYVATILTTDLAGTLTNAQIAALDAAKLTGQIAGTQIANGAISTPKLAAGAVTTNELAANAVTANNLAANSVVAGKVAANAIDVNALQANSVVAGKVAANAINAQAIQAGAISTDKLLVVGRGSALNDDPAGVDQTAWSLGAGTLQANVSNSNAPGGTVLRITNPANNSFGSRAFPVTPGKRYRLTAWAKQVSGSGLFYLRIYQLDAGGNLVAYDTGMEGLTLTNGFVRYFGLSTGAPTATVATIQCWTSYTASGVVDIADIRCEEAIPGELIVDGAITARTLAANSIAVGTAAIQNGALVNAMIGNAQIDDAKITTLSGTKIIANTIDASKITAGTITADRLNVLNSPNGAQIDMSAGRIVMNNGAYMKVMGTGFGTSNQFIEWYGPTRSVGACDESSAVYYLRTDGQAYFGGALLAGKLKNSVQATALDAGNLAVLGPFSSNGNQISITFSYSFSAHTTFPGTSTGLSNYNATAKQSPSFTIVLSRSLGGGGFADVSTISGTGTHSEFPPVPSDVAPGAYNQSMGGSSTFVDPSLSVQTREYRLRITGLSGVNAVVIANTLAIQSIEN